MTVDATQDRVRVGKRYLSRAAYERNLASSREAKVRRKEPCANGCGELTAWDNRTGLCFDCYKKAIEPPHGSYTRYSSKKWQCRCADCRAAWAAKWLEMYHRRVSA